MKNIVEERDLLLSKDKKFLSIMVCMISLMLIVGMCVFTFSYHDKISELMISGNEGGTMEKEVEVHTRNVPSVLKTAATTIKEMDQCKCYPSEIIILCDGNKVLDNSSLVSINAYCENSKHWMSVSGENENSVTLCGYSKKSDKKVVLNFNDKHTINDGGQVVSKLTLMEWAEVLNGLDFKVVYPEGKSSDGYTITKGDTFWDDAENKEVYAMAEDAFAYDIKTGKTVGITKKEAEKLEIKECISIINDENKAVSVVVK